MGRSFCQALLKLSTSDINDDDLIPLHDEDTPRLIDNHHGNSGETDEEGISEEVVESMSSSERSGG